MLPLIPKLILAYSNRASEGRLNLMTPSIRLVVFDLYGTLISYGVMHHPYRKILRWAREQGRKPQPDDARQLMTINDTPEAVFASLGIFPHRQLIDQFNAEIQEELNDLTLFDDVEPVLTALKGMGISIAVCSNLSKPYGAAIDNLLSQHVFIRSLSYAVGAIKPEAKIYDEIVNQSGVASSNVLFVGDTLTADFDGPCQYGFHALHLNRGKPSLNEKIGSLRDVLKNI